MKLFRISELEEVENILYELNKDIGYDKILIEESLGRILYEDIISEINVPHFTRSTVDGYALNHRSVNGATETIPILIKVIEKINPVHQWTPSAVTPISNKYNGKNGVSIV